MVVMTKRLKITQIKPQMISCLTPLLGHQNLFHQAGLATPGGINLQVMQLLAQNEILLAIERKNKGGVIGLVILLKTYDAAGKLINHQFEVGYLLPPSEQHHGYMTEALREICMALGQRKINLVAETKKQNEASQRVLQRCSFKQVASSTTIQNWQYMAQQ